MAVVRTHPTAIVKSAASPAQRAVGRRTQLAAWPAIILGVMVVDGVAILLAGGLAFNTRFCDDPVPLCTVQGAYPPASHPGYYLGVTLAYLLTCLVSIWVAGGYARRNLFRGVAEYRVIFSACAFATLIVEFGSFLTYRDFPVSRGWLLVAWLASVGFVFAGRFGLRRVLRALHARSLLVKPTLVVGAGHEGQMLEWHIHRAPSEGLRVLGFVDDSAQPGSEIVAGKPVLGTIADLSSLIERLCIEQVLVAVNDVGTANALRVLELALPSDTDVALAPDLLRTLTTDSHLARVGGDALLMVEKVRITGVDAVLKSLLDMILALLLLLVTAPIMLVITIATRIASPGPIFVRQATLGARGRTFHALKFRTTYHDGASTTDPDVIARRKSGLPLRWHPGTTPLGRFLARSSLDELPQLLNVLARQMSLVGPYKICPDQLHLYGDRRLAMFTMRPGITGVCQIRGRGELTVEERALLDTEYVRTYTIWRDLHILAQTIPAVLHGHGAY
jgi:exopolysaccharide biosynthesis polyprenyl glycosylphosphotransferase